MEVEKLHSVRSRRCLTFNFPESNPALKAALVSGCGGEGVIYTRMGCRLIGACRVSGLQSLQAVDAGWGVCCRLIGGVIWVDWRCVVS
jgi:hypothetical protein